MIDFFLYLLLFGGYVTLFLWLSSWFMCCYTSYYKSHRANNNNNNNNDNDDNDDDAPTGLVGASAI